MHNQGWFAFGFVQPGRLSTADVREAYGSGGSIRPALVLLFPEKQQRWAVLELLPFRPSRLGLAAEALV